MKRSESSRRYLIMRENL